MFVGATVAGRAKNYASWNDALKESKSDDDIDILKAWKIAIGKIKKALGE